VVVLLIYFDHPGLCRISYLKFSRAQRVNAAVARRRDQPAKPYCNRQFVNAACADMVNAAEQRELDR
jgi:hypothetical protein